MPFSEAGAGVPVHPDRHDRQRRGLSLADGPEGGASAAANLCAVHEPVQAADTSARPPGSGRSTTSPPICGAAPCPTNTVVAYMNDCHQLAGWATASGLEPDGVDLQGAAPLRRRAVGGRAGAEHGRAQAGRGAGAVPGADAARADGPEPRGSGGRAEAAQDASARAQARGGRAAARPHPRGHAAASSATARCSSSPTRRACVPRSWSTLRSARIDFDAETVRVEGKGGKTRLVPVGEHALAAICALPRARAAGVAHRAGGTRPAAQREPMFLSKTGRRLSTSDVRRRLRTWTRVTKGERAGARAGAPAYAAALVRHAPARGRGRPALDSGASRACHYLDHSGLHSGRVRAPQSGLCPRSSSGVDGARRFEWIQT